MKTRTIERLSQKQRTFCQTCGSKPWQAITVQGMIRRCLGCWWRIYFAKELTV